MRKNIVTSLFIVGLFSVLSSCDSKRKMLIGKWEYNTTISKEAGTGSVVVNSSGKVYFKSDDTYISKKNGTMSIMNKKIDITDVITKGTWSLSNEDDTEVYLTREMIESNYNERLKDGLRDAGYSEMVVEMMSDLIDKSSDNGGDISTDKIIKLNEKFLILETQGDFVDGHKTTYYRLDD